MTIDIVNITIDQDPASQQQDEGDPRVALAAIGKELAAKCCALEKANAHLQEAQRKIDWLESQEYKDTVGMDFLAQVVLNEIEAYENTNDSVARREAYKALAPIVLKIDGFPKEVTKRVLALAVTSCNNADRQFVIGQLNGTLNAPDNQIINHFNPTTNL